MVLKGDQGGKGVQEDRWVEEVDSFHTEYGMPSGPVAEEGDDLLGGSFISSLVRGGVEGSLDKPPLGGMGFFGGKK